MTGVSPTARHEVLFPCLRPSSEKDIAMLEEWLDKQLQPFAEMGGVYTVRHRRPVVLLLPFLTKTEPFLAVFPGTTAGMGMEDATYCLQVYNVGLNELYRQTAIASRHRARVLDSVWRGYVELLEHIREADGGAVRREMAMMQVSRGLQPQNPVDSPVCSCKAHVGPRRSGRCRPTPGRPSRR